MNPSARCVEFVKAHEGCRLTAYRDPVGVLTIGYGHTGTFVTEGLEITQAEADSLLTADLGAAGAAVDRLVAVPINQDQFDALTSFVFNVGARAFENSTLRKKLNAGDRAGAADELLRWDHAGGNVLPGLTKRRAAERAMFLGVDMPQDAPAPPAPPMSGNEPPIGAYEPPMNNEIMQPEGPMLPILGAVLPSLVGAIPELIKILGDKNAQVSDRNVAAATKVMDVIVRSTGATNEQDAAQKVLADPQAAQVARAAVQAAYYELVEVGGGLPAARTFVQQITTTGPDWQRIAGTTFIGALALTIVVGGGVMFWSLLHDAGVSSEQKAMLIGAVISLVGSPIAFFFGSSASSRRKDDALSSK